VPLRNGRRNCSAHTLGPHKQREAGFERSNLARCKPRVNNVRVIVKVVTNSFEVGNEGLYTITPAVAWKSKDRSPNRLVTDLSSATYTHAHHSSNHSKA
jgi:hypothetical protein